MGIELGHSAHSGSSYSSDDALVTQRDQQDEQIPQQMDAIDINSTELMQVGILASEDMQIIADTEPNNVNVLQTFQSELTQQ